MSDPVPVLLETPNEVRWSNAELYEELSGYGKELQRAGLEALAVKTYMDRARYFLEWHSTASATELAARLANFQLTLEARGRKDLTVRSYVDGASRFLRWLVGDYEPGTRTHRLKSARELDPSTGAKPGNPAPADGAAGYAIDPDTAVGGSHKADWRWEGNVVAAIAMHLSGEGWNLDRVADTERRERGIDIRASRSDEQLLVEVKGYPSTTYIRGTRAGRKKRAHPSLLASHYLSSAVFTTIGLRAANTKASVAIGLPDTARYRDLLSRLRDTLHTLRIDVLLVQSDGLVKRLPKVTSGTETPLLGSPKGST